MSTGHLVSCLPPTVLCFLSGTRCLPPLVSCVCCPLWLAPCLLVPIVCSRIPCSIFPARHVLSPVSIVPCSPISCTCCPLFAYPNANGSGAGPGMSWNRPPGRSPQGRPGSCPEHPGRGGGVHKPKLAPPLSYNQGKCPPGPSHQVELRPRDPVAQDKED